MLGLWLLTLAVVVGLCTAAKAREHVHLRAYSPRQRDFSRSSATASSL
jgi:hypothetical protein